MDVQGIVHSNVLVLNANGIISKKDIIDLFVSQVQPLLVSVVESHVTESDEEVLIAIKGYNCIRCDTDTRHTGGLVMYIRDDLGYEEIFREVKQRDWWILGIKLYIETHLIGTFTGVYRSPSSAKGEFIDRFSVIMEELLDISQKDCTIMGDFNIDWMKEDDYYTNKLKASVRGVGLKQMVANETRVTKETRTLIDHVLTDNINLQCEVLVKPIISDHYIISIQGIINNISNKRNKFLMKGKLDYCKMTNLLESKYINWELEKDSDIEREYEVLKENIKQVMQESRNQDRWVKSKPCPWFSLELKQHMKERDIAYSRFLITNEVGRGIEEAWQIIYLIEINLSIVGERLKGNIIKTAFIA